MAEHMSQPSPTARKTRQVLFVGKKIRDLRKERGFTQTELSARIGIQQSDLSRMENGEYRVGLDTLFRILAELELSVGEFFDEAVRQSLTPRDLRLVRDFSSLDPKAQREVEELVALKRSQKQPNKRETS